MRNSTLVDLYSDYLLSGFGLSTSTGMSKMLDNAYSHDQISRFMAQPDMTQKEYWKSIKPIVRRIESEQGIIIIDDFIIHKPHSTMNDIVNYHFDHTSGVNVKGINVVSFLYNAQEIDVQLPIAFELVSKPNKYKDPETGKEKRRSEISKNEILRDRLAFLTQRNQVKYKYVAFDIWFSSNENFKMIHHDLKKCFVSAIKSNRKVALSVEEKLQGKFIKVSDIDLQSGSSIKVWIKGLNFEVRLVKQVFTNKDGSTGVLYLVSNDLELSYEEHIAIYQKRWKVEEFHKSAKQNAGIGRSPTKYELTQSNHIFGSMISVCKLELLKIKHKKNHFALKAQLYLKAMKAAFEELQNLKQSVLMIEHQQYSTLPILALS